MPRSATRTEPNDQKTLEKSDGTAAGISGAESPARAAAHTERPPALTMAARERERERENEACLTLFPFKFDTLLCTHNEVWFCKTESLSLSLNLN